MTVIVIKRKRIIGIVLLLLATALCLYAVDSRIVDSGIVLKKEVIETTFLPIQNRVVAIDAGHGGIDSGALGVLEASEAEINLKISLKLRNMIEQNGGITVMTREDENGLYTEESMSVKEKKNEDLRNRRILVNESDPDAFISIHLNSFPEEKYYGAQTFYKEGCDRSDKLANMIQEELRKSLDKNNERVPQSRNTIYLLREIEKPAVLVESGFLSNRKEEELLNNENYQEKVAWAIYMGLTRYFTEE